MSSINAFINVFWATVLTPLLMHNVIMHDDNALIKVWFVDKMLLERSFTKCIINEDTIFLRVCAELLWKMRLFMIRL